MLFFFFIFCFFIFNYGCRVKSSTFAFTRSRVSNDLVSKFRPTTRSRPLYLRRLFVTNKPDDPKFGCEIGEEKKKESSIVAERYSLLSTRKNWLPWHFGAFRFLPLSFGILIASRLTYFLWPLLSLSSHKVHC